MADQDRDSSSVEEAENEDERDDKMVEEDSQEEQDGDSELTISKKLLPNFETEDQLIRPKAIEFKPTKKQTRRNVVVDDGGDNKKHVTSIALVGAVRAITVIEWCAQNKRDPDFSLDLINRMLRQMGSPIPKKMSTIIQNLKTWYKFALAYAGQHTHAKWKSDENLPLPKKVGAKYEWLPQQSDRLVKLKPFPKNITADLKAFGPNTDITVIN